MSLGSLFAIGALIFLKLQPHAEDYSQEKEAMDEAMTAEFGRENAKPVSRSMVEIESTWAH